MTVFIGWPGPPFPETEKQSDFTRLQDCMDRDTWIGRACTERLPGGGSNDGSNEDNKK